MPWSNQGGGGGGPWGSGGKGPWGSGPQSSGPTPPDLEEILRRGQDKLRQCAARRQSRRQGVRAAWPCGHRAVGIVGFLPGRAGRTRRRAALRQICPRRQPGLNYHLPYPIESGAHAQGDARQSDRHRHASGRGRAPRATHARCARGKPDADRRREHRRCRLLGVLESEADRCRPNICSTSRIRKAP